MLAQGLPWLVARALIQLNGDSGTGSNISTTYKAPPFPEGGAMRFILATVALRSVASPYLSCIAACG